LLILAGRFIRHMKIHGESFFHPGNAEKAWARARPSWYAAQKAEGRARQKSKALL
jgi:hypothetical protein